MTRASVAAALALLLTFTAAPATADALTGIHVTGVGELQVVPDTAQVTLEVRREGTDPAALKTELDRVTADVLKLTADLGIPKRQVTAAAVNIFPRYRSDDDDDQKPAGVIASRTLDIKVEHLSHLGELINGALQRGVNGVRDVSLDVSNRIELEQRALSAAIDDATRQAQHIADRFKVELGPLKDASASSHQVRPMMSMAMEARKAPAPDAFAPGEMTIRQEVQATFGIRH